MKNTIAYILILLVSFAYSHKTIEYFSQTIGHVSIAWEDDMNCDEKNSESKKANEKNEKKDFSEYLFSNKTNAFVIIDKLSLKHQFMCLYASSDYSKMVYSPPEQAVI